MLTSARYLVEHIIITAHELSNVIHADRLHAHVFACQLHASLWGQGNGREEAPQECQATWKNKSTPR